MDRINSETMDVLRLLAQGGTIRYFYLTDVCAVHKKMGEPDDEAICPINVFIELWKKELIIFISRNETGSPHYAEEAKNDIYAITEKGIELCKG